MPISDNIYLGVLGSEDGPEFGDGDLSLVFESVLVFLKEGFLAVLGTRDDPFEFRLVSDVVPERIFKL